MTQRPGTLKQSCAAGLLCSSILLGALQLAAPWVQAATASENAKAATRALKQTSNYTVTSAPIEQLHLEEPTLPDLSGYTAAAVVA